jgi:hypothetical protein
VGSVVVILGARVCGTWIGQTSWRYKALDELPVHVDQTISEGFSRSPAFRDPIEDFKTPVAIRKISETIDNESAELEGRIRKIFDSSDEPIGDEPETVSLYIVTGFLSNPPCWPGATATDRLSRH